MFSKDFRFAQTQGLQVRVEMFNIANRLNYENPAATLPNGTPGVPFTDAQAGTFGYMLGPAQPHGRARQWGAAPGLAPLSPSFASVVEGGSPRPRVPRTQE